MNDALLARLGKLRRGEYEADHPHSELAKIMEDDCLRLISNDPNYFIRKEFSIDTSSNELVWLIIFTQLAKEDCKIDYINDDFSIIDCTREVDDIATVYATYLFNKYLDFPNDFDIFPHLADPLVSHSDIRTKIDPDFLDYFEAAYYLTSGQHFMRDYDFINHNPICTIAESAYYMIASFHNSDVEEVEYNIWDYYDYIEDDVIFGLEKKPDSNRVKLLIIHSMLYHVAAMLNREAFIKYSKLGKPLPKAIMIYLYIILNIHMKVAENTLYLPLLSGRINDMSIEALDIFQVLINDLFNDKADEELSKATTEMTIKYVFS